MKRESAEAILTFTGILYGILGLAFIPGLLFNVMYAPTITHSWRKSDILSWPLFLGIPFAIIIIHFLILYSFWRLRRWGRYLAIIYNGVIVMYLVFILIATQISEGKLTLNIPTISLFMIVILVGAVLIFLFHPKVKELMSHAIADKISD